MDGVQRLSREDKRCAFPPGIDVSRTVGASKRWFVLDNRAHETVKLSIPELGAIMELGREKSQERIATRGLQRFRESEDSGELRVGKGNGEGGRRSDMRHSADQCLNIEPTSLGLVGVLAALRRRPLDPAELNRGRISAELPAFDRSKPIVKPLAFQPRQNVFAAVPTLPGQGYIARFCVTLVPDTRSAMLAELANRRAWVVRHWESRCAGSAAG
jgi:hypothetical protein